METAVFEKSDEKSEEQPVLSEIIVKYYRKRLAISMCCQYWFDCYLTTKKQKSKNKPFLS